MDIYKSVISISISYYSQSTCVICVYYVDKIIYMYENISKNDRKEVKKIKTIIGSM